MRAIVRDWIYAVVEDAGSDLMGVMEMFDVGEAEAREVLADARIWLQGNPIRAKGE